MKRIATIALALLMVVSITTPSGFAFAATASQDVLAGEASAFQTRELPAQAMDGEGVFFQIDESTKLLVEPTRGLRSNLNSTAPAYVTVSENFRTTQISEESYATEYEVVHYPNASSSLRDSQTGGKGNSIETKIKIFYNLRNNMQQIQITKIEGSWKAAYSGVGLDLQNSVVSISDGAGVWGPKNLKWYNPPREYSYNTGWGFVENYPASEVSGPFGYMETDYRLTSMGSTWLHDYTGLRLSFVDF